MRALAFIAGPLFLLALMGLGGDVPPAAAPLAAAATTPPVTDVSVGVIALLREFGFPVFVTLWFMWRIEKKIDKFTEQIEKLITIVTVMTKVVDLDGGK